MKSTTILLSLLAAVFCAAALAGCTTWDAPPEEQPGACAGQPGQF